MALVEFWSWLENLSLAMRIGESAWFPFLESLHVVAVTFVFGSILVVDLRLIGIGNRSHEVRRLTGELLPWTWGAFVLSVVTGAGLFITRASHYAENPAFQIKAALLLLAGLNMVFLHFRTFRDVAQWNSGTTPPAAKFAGVASLAIWVGVILAGRWVGHLN